MPILNHKFLNHEIQKDTEVLIIGTFNPDVLGNEAEFFYGRQRNYLWKLLPVAFGAQDLRGVSRFKKEEFMKEHKIDFVDLIQTVNVAAGHENDYSDAYIDSCMPALGSRWKNIESLINNQQGTIRKVCFTRKTFSDIPNITHKINRIEEYCIARNIIFGYLISPARYYSNAKQIKWDAFFA
ncbi:MAG: hypothetical protein ABIA97_00675 [Candidatus Omnitrophota bacterium]